MKKLTVLLCAATLAGNAQPYGEQLYPHAGSFCSSGALTAVNSAGFVTSGYVPTIALGNPNYFIDKTGPSGVFSPPATSFSKAYFIGGNRQCSASPQQAQLMIGTDVIEATSSTIGGWYAKAGVFENGVFFAMLNVTGVPVSTAFYPFPQQATSFTRPTIIASSVATEYFICGSYQLAGTGIMYMLNVKELGNLAAAGSRTYRLTAPNTNASVIPNDMVLSPYFPAGVPEIIVVGKILNSFGSAGAGTRAFLGRLNVNTLMPSGGFPFRIFGQSATVNKDDEFSSVTVASSTTGGGNGFVIGGFTDLYGTSGGQAWMLKLDPTANTIYWNTVTKPVNDPAAGNVLAIKERLSTTFSAYEYYGAVTSTAGMMVLKLNDSGLPFTVGTPPVSNYNEFIYFGNQSSGAAVRDLTYINSGPTDVGIQVYGTDPGNTGGNHHFVEAGFNGDPGLTTCSNSSHTTGATSQVGPPNQYFRDFILQAGLVQCGNFNMAAKVTPVTPIVICSSTSLPAGSNNRSIATGIGTQQSGNSLFSVSPNPVSDKLEIKFNATGNDQVDIKLYDYLGRVIRAIPVLSTEAGVAGLDMSTLSIESGIYIINATINGVSTQQKIIYTKGQ